MSKQTQSAGVKQCKVDVRARAYLWCAGHRIGHTPFQHHTADVHGVQAVHIFLVADVLENDCLVNVRR